MKEPSTIDIIISAVWLLLGIFVMANGDFAGGIGCFILMKLYLS